MTPRTDSSDRFAEGVRPVEFEPWPKIARLNRDIVITEKLDGTNAAVVIVQQPFGGGAYPDYNRMAITLRTGELLADDGLPDFEYHVYAQSRNRFITEKDDNHGFAVWVKANAEALVNSLGAGRHFGEWWGAGIGRKYGETSKTFSLFNTGRWNSLEVSTFGIPQLDVVPVLYAGPFADGVVSTIVEHLCEHGSIAAPGWMTPEGVVIWHEAARQLFKVTLVGDEAPKLGQRSGHDLLPSAVAA